MIIFIVLFLLVLGIEIAIKYHRLKKQGMLPSQQRQRYYSYGYGYGPYSAPRPPIMPAVRMMVFQRNLVDKGPGYAIYCCSYCGGTGYSRAGPDMRPWEIDHITPYSWGGPSTIENLTLACATCNQRKGAERWPVRYPIDLSATSA